MADLSRQFHREPKPPHARRPSRIGPGLVRSIEGWLISTIGRRVA
jgi:hypothetical protein